MAKKTKVEVPVPETTAGLRRCIGSARYGIVAHEAPAGDFPVQPSQKDGLGRMCKSHWNAYTAGLARDAKARKAGDGGAIAQAAEPVADEAAAVEPAITAKRRRIASTGQGHRYGEDEVPQGGAG